MWPLSFWGNLKTSVYPLVLGRVVNYEGFKIMAHSPIVGHGFVEKGVTHIFEAREDALEFIVAFKDG